MRPGERLQVERYPDGAWVTVAESEYCADLKRVAFGLVAVAGIADHVRHELETSAGWVLIAEMTPAGYLEAQTALFGTGPGLNVDPGADFALYGDGAS